jgi:hypothetical protein
MIGGIPFANCMGDGTVPRHSPVPVVGTEEGSYRTEVKIVVGAYQSPVVGYDFYAHHSLDGVARCMPPHTDDQIFTAAQAIAGFVSTPFDASTVVDAPFIHLPFKNVIRYPNMNDGYPSSFDTGDPMDVDVLTLRRRFVLNSARTLLLIQRTHESRMHRNNPGPPGTGTCRNSFRFGDNHNVTDNPRRFVDCKNFVLNSRGQGRCIDPALATPAFQSTEIGWAKLIQRRRSFSLKGLTEDCTPSVDVTCFSWYLHLPD